MNVDELDLRAYPINAHVYVHMHCMHKLDPEVDSRWGWCNVHSVQAWNCTQLANGITLNSKRLFGVGTCKILPSA